jgi:protein-disulfide isomerase
MKRIIFWIGFIFILALIVWGLVVAGQKNQDGFSRELVVPVSESDHVIGNPNAPVTLVEYSDFQCPACGIYFPIVEKLLSEASSTVKLVYRHFPLSQHIHAEISAQASEAAGLQGKFAEMYRKIFSNQSEWENLKTTAESAIVFERYAKEIGLNMAKYSIDINSDAVKKKVADDLAGGIRSGVNSTPTFFINGKAMAPVNNYDEFKANIEKASQSVSN